MSGDDGAVQEQNFAADGLSKNRLEALADGIMSVAMTLLVLDLKFEGKVSIATDGELIARLLDIERSFSVYVVSFAVLGMYWVAHDVQYHYVRRTDRGLLWINLAFLLLVTLVPFTTSLMIDYEQLRLPVMLYGVNQLLLSLTLLANLTYVARRPRLAEASLTPEIVAYVRRRMLFFASVPAASILIAFVNTRVALNLYFVMAIVHFMPKSVDSNMRRWFERRR